MREHPDELLADFQETYHLNLWELGVLGDETTTDVLRAAALARQLPHDSRTYVAEDPTLANGTVERLLRQMELNQRGYAWAQSKDGKSGTNEPQPIPLPGEELMTERKAEQAERDMGDVAAAFGMSL